MDDLIDDAGEEPLSATDMIKMRRQMREAAAAAERDSEPNPEELEKYIKERFGNNRGCVGGCCAGGAVLWVGAVQWVCWWQVTCWSGCSRGGRGS